LASPLEISPLIEKVRIYNPRADFELIGRAYEFAAKAHEGQTRKSGEPYVTHPVAVAGVVADLHLDESSICAAILHDTVEDTETTVEELEGVFGETIARLVDGLTKLAKIQFKSNQQRQAENFRKMILAMSKDLRVILVKLADRLHNMRTLEHMREEKRRTIAQETIDIYAPLANRLGINAVKQELEDLSFRFLEAEDYDLLAQKVKNTRKEREQYTQSVIKGLEGLLGEHGLEVKVSGRPKHLYSIWNKMRRQGIDFDHVYDLLGFRILTETERDCYHALGLVHMEWRPIPGRFKDYIALPKANNYRSLHTAVIGPKGQRIEVQIRTREMHQVSEYGVAAHWQYKEGGSDSVSGDQEKFAWLQQLVKWQRELKDPDDFLDTMKMDLFSEDVYIFTPQGELRVLPRGSTPVDFAYMIHSEVGDRCSGSLVNGRMVQLNYQLRNGDMVEIITRGRESPNADWLRFVRTGKARNHIRAHQRRAQHQVALGLGKELLDKELKRYGDSFHKATKKGRLAAAAKQLGEKDVEALVAKVGFQTLHAGKAARSILPEGAVRLDSVADEKDRASKDLGSIMERMAKTLGDTLMGNRSGIRVDGLENVLVRTARCCQPLPGEAIIGFVTMGRGVSIHARTCKNMMSSDPGRVVDAYWDAKSGGGHSALVRVVCHNTSGKLADMSQVFSLRKINILSANCQASDDDTAVNDFEVVVNDSGQLRKALTALRALPGVISVERVRSV